MQQSKTRMEPFFRGVSVVAFERDVGSSRLLGLEPRDGRRFDTLPGTTTVYLPPERIVAVEGTDAGLRFRGDFHLVERPGVVDVAPVDAVDVRGLVAALGQRYGLPRVPLDVPLRTLVELRPGAFVTTVGTRERTHIEAADFGPVALEVRVDRTVDNGELVRAVGFFEPGARSGGIPVVGYSGPRLSAVDVLDPGVFPESRHAGGVVVRAFVGGRRSAAWWPSAAVWRFALEERRTVVALIAGAGAQKTWPWASDAASHVGRWLLASDRVAAAPPPPARSGAANEATLDATVASVVDRSPLPRDPEGLVSALAARLGAVLSALNGKGFALGADGVIAAVDERAVCVLLRGMARVLRAGRAPAEILLHEHTLAAEYAAQGMAVDEAWGRQAASGFNPEASRGPAPVRLHAAAGDRVTVLADNVLQARTDGAVARALHRDTFAERVRALAEDGPPIDGDRWGLLEIDFGAAES